MSYNILKKNVKFSGPADGTIEGMIDVSSSQEIVGDKTFASTITSSADVMLSGSGKVSASFFYGDGSNLSGVSGVPAGTDGNIQFTDGSSLGASSNLTFFTSSNKLEVLGEISASVNVSASAFYGDGANLTSVTASFVTASNIEGLITADKINKAPGLSNDAGFLTIDTASNGGITISSGLAIDANDLPSAAWSSDGDTIVGYIGGNTRKIEFSELTDHLPIDANNIDSGTLLNARLPTTIDINVVSASTGISGAFFQGDGSGLTGVTGTPTPAGANTQIQFNDDGALAGDADLTFLTGSNTLATTIVSASAHISASEFATAGGTVVDSDGNFQGNNASFNEITASSDISSSADIYGLNFRGNGSTLDNVPLVSSNAASVVFVDNVSNKTITSNSNFTYNGSDVLNSAGGFSGSTDLQVGGHISGSGDIVLLNDGNIVLGANSSIRFDDGAGVDTFIDQDATNQLRIDGDNRVTVRADQYVIFQDENDNDRLTIDYRTTDPTTIQQIRTDLMFTSSAEISASSVYLAEGMNIGGETIFNNQGNIVGTSATAVITIADNPTNGDTLSFGDSTITPVVVSTYDTRGVSPNIAIGLTEAATRTNTKNRLESLHNVSVTINGDDLEITNNNLGLIGNRTISETFTSTNNSVSGFTGGYSIDIYANDITASSFSSPDGTLISAEGNFQGNNASFNEITASSVISSSAEISASAFYGDGSNLQNISATPQYRYYQVRGYVATSGITYFNPYQTGGSDNPNVQPNQKFAAPGDGSIVRWIITPASNTAPTPGQSMKTFFLKNSNSLASSGEATAHVTGTVDLALNISGIGNTSGSIVDWTGTNLTVSGSNSFSAGDQLLFGLGPDSNMGDCSVAVILKIDESITYG